MFSAGRLVRIGGEIFAMELIWIDADENEKLKQIAVAKRDKVAKLSVDGSRTEKTLDTVRKRSR